MKIILITGGTASGKTTLSNIIKGQLGENKVNVLSLDNYYFPETHYQDKANINWDSTAAYNWKKILSDIENLKNQKQIKVPKFIYGANIYTKNKELITPKDILIIEGIFSFNLVNILKYDTFNVFLNIDEQVRKVRRIERDKKLVPNFDLNILNQKWDKIIESTYQTKILPEIKKANLILKTNNEIEIKNLIKKLLKF